MLTNMDFYRRVQLAQITNSQIIALTYPYILSTSNRLQIQLHLMLILLMIHDFDVDADQDNVDDDESNSVVGVVT